MPFSKGITMYEENLDSEYPNITTGLAIDIWETCIWQMLRANLTTDNVYSGNNL